MNYVMNVIQPIEDAPAPGGQVYQMHVLNVQVDRSLGWVKQHADEIAAKAVPGGYSALWVAEAP